MGETDCVHLQCTQSDSQSLKWKLRTSDLGRIAQKGKVNCAHSHTHLGVQSWAFRVGQDVGSCQSHLKCEKTKVSAGPWWLRGGSTFILDGAGLLLPPAAPSLLSLSDRWVWLEHSYLVT